ncbi:hypothetical protein GUJ93_ZPchr0006g41618 [Zizania palustris]|uniref:Phytocyanin domain-containing protein n=1 Tax=Zizania palustris TaxID=103762 RepID=A0A8J5S7H5_ZIZPA|nr:hypothetical protein GUJ93_ZPchr0006g41618 [Zizania palustris]
MASGCSCDGVIGLVACFTLLHGVIIAAGATQYKVGDGGGWGVPDASAESYNSWAEKTSFQIGDELLFVYPKDSDSVLLVEPADYNSCNTASYDKKFDDGSTAFTLDRAGAFFFISGVDANCRANEKLIVMVAAAAGTTPPPSSSSPSSPSSGGAPGAQTPPDARGRNSTAAGGGATSGTGLTVAAGLAGSVMASIAYAAVLAI